MIAGLLIVALVLLALLTLGPGRGSATLHAVLVYGLAGLLALVCFYLLVPYLR